MFSANIKECSTASIDIFMISSLFVFETNASNNAVTMMFVWSLSKTLLSSSSQMYPSVLSDDCLILSSSLYELVQRFWMMSCHSHLGSSKHATVATQLHADSRTEPLSSARGAKILFLSSSFCSADKEYQKGSGSPPLTEFLNSTPAKCRDEASSNGLFNCSVIVYTKS